MLGIQQSPFDSLYSAPSSSTMNDTAMQSSHVNGHITSIGAFSCTVALVNIGDIDVHFGTRSRDTDKMWGGSGAYIGRPVTVEIVLERRANHGPLAISISLQQHTNSAPEDWQDIEQISRNVFDKKIKCPSFLATLTVPFGVIIECTDDETKVFSAASGVFSIPRRFTRGIRELKIGRFISYEKVSNEKVENDFNNIEVLGRFYEVNNVGRSLIGFWVTGVVYRVESGCAYIWNDHFTRIKVPSELSTKLKKNDVVSGNITFNTDKTAPWSAMSVNIHWIQQAYRRKLHAKKLEVIDGWKVWSMKQREGRVYGCAHSNSHGIAFFTSHDMEDGADMPPLGATVTMTAYREDINNRYRGILVTVTALPEKPPLTHPNAILETVEVSPEPSKSPVPAWIDFPQPLSSIPPVWIDAPPGLTIGKPPKTIEQGQYEKESMEKVAAPRNDVLVNGLWLNTTPVPGSLDETILMELMREMEFQAELFDFYPDIFHQLRKNTTWFATCLAKI